MGSSEAGEYPSCESVSCMTTSDTGEPLQYLKNRLLSLLVQSKLYLFNESHWKKSFMSLSVLPVNKYLQSFFFNLKSYTLKVVRELNLHV